MSIEPVTPLSGTPKPRASQPGGAPAKGNVQRVMEGITDVVAIAGLVALAWVGRLPGEWAGVLVALLAGVRITDIVAGRGGQLPPGGAGGVTGAIVGLVSTLLHRGGGAAALVLGLAAAGALSGCSAAQTLNAKPVWGMRSDLEFGRCAYAGTWVGTAPGARTLMTAHACLRVENGSTPAPDAAPDAALAGDASAP